MFTKRITTGSTAGKSASGMVASSEPVDQFPKGTQFTFDGKLWKVAEVVSDTDASWRRVRSDFGDEELMTLDTLAKDMRTGKLQIVSAPKAIVPPVPHRF